jgi:acyl-CoA reductase-like NAD-dependent aldehyde dehydrogenase
MIFTLLTTVNRCQILTLFVATEQTWRQPKRNVAKENANLTLHWVPIFIIAAITPWFFYVR